MDDFFIYFKALKHLIHFNFYLKMFGIEIKIKINIFLIKKKFQTY